MTGLPLLWRGNDGEVKRLQVENINFSIIVHALLIIYCHDHKENFNIGNKFFYI